ncbi:MAG: hypothetical protein IKH82_00770 [Clostridiales bacterium]|nr:hypothetical protein [Clostridiales bacterium]
MGYRLELCKACQRLYVVEDEGPAGGCPHCRDAEQRVLTGKNRSALDRQEKKLYAELEELNKKIDEAESNVKPPKPPKTPWTPSQIIGAIVITALGLAIPVAGLIRDPGGWIYLAIAAAVSALFFLGFEIVKLIRKPKDKAELNKLIQEREEIYGKLASILIAKSSYSNEQVEDNI